MRAAVGSGRRDFQIDDLSVGISGRKRDAFLGEPAFVKSGGNLVLSDGAARALPHLGIDTPADVRALLVYTPFIGFTTDGADSTYADPLARNVNQPGAAEGAGRRHQPVEPVPLGYSIQDGDGANKGHSFTRIVTPIAAHQAPEGHADNRRDRGPRERDPRVATFDRVRLWEE